MTSKTDSKDWINKFHKIFDDLEKESDRGSVLVVGALLEHVLKEHINIRLLPAKTQYDAVSSNLNNFASAIDLAYRIGVITTQEHQVYHHVRKLRNQCAHDIDVREFDQPVFKETIYKIIKDSEEFWQAFTVSLGKLIFPDKNLSTPQSFVDQLGLRKSFELTMSLIIAYKQASAHRVRKIIPLDQPHIIIDPKTGQTL